ncbi:ATP-grasp domain-containing protein [Candidatus Woesearchaeota archaeon]|nr:ATP-grasp domain-containing protein [Candidatus Woesearchaeota archaeon]
MNEVLTDKDSNLINVLVFPSCNYPGLEIIEAIIKHPRINVFGGSSIGSKLDRSYALLKRNYFFIPNIDDDKFYKSMHGLCKEHSIDIVFPTVDAVIALMASWSGQDFSVIAPSANLANLALYKSKIYKALFGKIPLPNMYSNDMSYPVFAKPDIGSGSNGIRKIDSYLEYDRLNKEGMMIQEYLPGHEYTVDCISDLDGLLISYNVRLRSQIYAGSSHATSCIEHTEIGENIKIIACNLRLSGPWFAQFKLDKENVPKLMEVNARIAGSSGASRLSGFNIPLMSVLLFSGYSITAPRKIASVSINKENRLSGDIDDFNWVIWDLDDTITSSTGVVDPDIVAWLYRFNNSGKLQLLLSKNHNPKKVIKELKIPNFFIDIICASDKKLSLKKIFSKYSMNTSDTVMINDSNSEKSLILHEYPMLRWVAPDAINVFKR